MFDTVQLLSLGAAAVIDTVLLLVMLEQRNRQFTRVPLVVMVAGAWLWHGGLFSLLLLAEFSGWAAWELQWACFVVILVGLLLMPCGMTHMTARLLRHGAQVLPRGNPWHMLAYLPLLAIVPLALRLSPPPPSRELEPLLAFALPYIFWAGLVKLAAIWALLRSRTRLDIPNAGRFFVQMAGVLAGMILVQWGIFFVLLPFWPAGERYLILVAALSPLAPTLLLAYFVLRYNFMQLMLERTLVYGGIVAGTVLFHQIAFQGITTVLPERYRLPLIVLECIALVSFVLVYQPLRQRIAEALRYLLGRRVAQSREQLRRLATEMSARAGLAPAELLGWFAPRLRDALAVDYVAGWLFHPSGDIRVRCGDADRLSTDEVARLRDRLREAGVAWCNPRTAPSPALADALRSSHTCLAVLKGYQDVLGMLLVGWRRGNLELGEETTNSVLLLVEQLAITAENSLLQGERLAAERRLLQSEKLSALGLLASSIAHEVKNPLSAIKTITTVILEELGPEASHAEGLNLVLGEVNRLSASTARILDFARPGAKGADSACVGKAIFGILQVLGHLARQQGIRMETHLEDNLPTVHADETSLREIFFNLLSNSLEAAGPGGSVHVACRRENGCVIAEVRDSGPGIPAKQRERLFEPFHSTKPDGTGLGLYLVGRHVRELGGEVRCVSGADGTTFFVKLRAL